MRTLSAFICASFCLLAFQGRAAATSVSICDSTAGNLVSNCGFETGDFTSWTLSGNDVPTELGYQYGVEGQDPLDSISPNSGNYQAFFADIDANATTLSQSIATTSGDEYQISFYLAQDTPVRGGYSNLFSASFGGTTLTSMTAVGVQGYTQYSYDAVASASSSVLSFTLGNDLGEFLLDDVVVTSATPEPGTWLLLSAAAGLCLLLRGRRILT
jgi:hypothetical protein